MNAHGSSLRTRGTEGVIREPGYLRRFIPAYAGNGMCGRKSDSELTVHPCVRGEREADAVRLTLAIGSSLRTRGTVWFV